MKLLPWAGIACVLALAAACSQRPDVSTTAPTAVTGDDNAAADGTTLKAFPPTLVSPANEVQLTTRQPTMQITTATGKFANRTYTYEFQLMTDAGAVIATTILNPSGTTVTWNYPTELDRDTLYRWRARARLLEAFGPWTATWRFRTVRENRTPDPPPGGRLPLPNRASVVGQVAAQNFSIFVNNSCQEHDPVGGWRFLDLLLDTLRQEDTRWGYNCKRLNCNDPSHDVIVYNWGPGPDQGKSTVYALDVILGHCGPTPSPAWIDITDPFGAGAAFTSRGRW